MGMGNILMDEAGERFDERKREREVAGAGSACIRWDGEQGLDMSCGYQCRSLFFFFGFGKASD